jgi:hypothetical protein
LGLGALVLVVLGIACIPLLQMTRVAAAQGGSGSEAAGVIDRFEQARSRRDFDAALAFFADDATITDRGSQTYRGKEEIRRYLQLVGNRGRSPVVSNRRANGTRVTWTERLAGQATLTFELNAEAVVREGKIRSLAYTALGAAGRADPAIDGRAQLPAFVGLASVLVMLAGGVGLVSLAGARPSTGVWHSQLRGRLVHELGAWSASQRRPLG